MTLFRLSPASVFVCPICSAELEVKLSRLHYPPSHPDSHSPLVSSALTLSASASASAGTLSDLNIAHGPVSFFSCCC